MGGKAPGTGTGPVRRGGAARVRIRAAHGVADLARVRRLLQEYHRSLGVDLCFQGFEGELAGLPGEYAPPGGGLWVAWADRRPVGCVALRRLDARRAEMKRLYVRPAARGRGLGARLARRALVAARRRGYAWLYLDTLPTMRAARALYARLGFARTRAYRYNPVPGSAFLRLDLALHRPRPAPREAK